MGCGSSREEPVDLAALAPRVSSGTGNVRPHSPFADLDKETLEFGLKQVADYIARRRYNIRIVAVGGAVSTILLQSRRITHDIDFFAEGMAPRETDLLLEAADFVRQQNPQLGFKDDWINNRTVYFIDPVLRQALTKEGFEQSEILFKAPGLTVYAAPWAYAFASKLDRIQGRGYRSHDPSDAATFLSCAFRRKNVTEINFDQVVGVMERYKLRIGNSEDLQFACRIVNDAYEQRFGYRPIQR